MHRPIMNNHYIPNTQFWRNKFIALKVIKKTIGKFSQFILTNQNIIFTFNRIFKLDIKKI